MSSQEQEENREAITLEAITLDALVEAWNAFVLLKSTHPDDLSDFRRAIHECQRIIAVRQLRRINPDTWVSLAAGESDDKLAR